MRMRGSNAGGQGPRRSNQRDECQNGEGVLKALDSRDAIDLERALATEGDAPAASSAACRSASVRADGREQHDHLGEHGQQPEPHHAATVAIATFRTALSTVSGTGPPRASAARRRPRG
jgi:hypothetical protein